MSLLYWDKTQKYKTMRNQKVMNIKQLLEASDLSQIMRKGILLNELNSRLQLLLPAQFKGLFRISNFSENSLNIEVASAVVRQGFLFRQQELLNLIQRDYPHIKQLNFKINPLLAQVKPT